MILARLDAFILKRLYQPIANLSARRFGTSCYWLAGHAAIVGCIGILSGAIAVLSSAGFDVLIASVALMHLAYSAWAFRMAQRQERLRARGAAALQRGARGFKIWGLAAVLNLPLIWLHGWRDVAYCCGALGYFSFAYFMACLSG